VFGGSAWEWHEPTGQYYLHSFLASQPDLNWRNPQVREAMYDTLRFWLDRGVDGLRIDVAHYLMKDPDFRDNPPAPTEGESFFKHLGDYERFHHIHSKGHPDVHTVFRDVRALLDEYEGQRFSVGEIHEEDYTAWAGYYGEHLDELHMPFNFSLLYAPWDATELRRRIDAVEEALPDGAWPNYVLGNHDESRIASRFGPHRTRALAVVLLTLRGTPTMYYGDELGMRDIDVPAGEIQDPWGIQVPGLSRDGCRSPMQWDGRPQGGFTEGDVKPWLPVHEDVATCNVASQVADPSSLLHLYRRLLELRRNELALRVGAYRADNNAPPGVFAFHRTHGDDHMYVAVNTADEPRRVSLPRSGHVVISTWNSDGMNATGNTVLIPADGAAIVRLDTRR
jgi:glycosidase